jgi:cell division protein FtsB
MAVVNPRNDPVRLMWRRVFMLGLSVVLFFGVWAVIGVYIKERESSNLRIQAETQLRDLKVREAQLKAKIASLETARGQEEALREAYQVGLEGEGEVTIVDRPSPTTSSPSEDHTPWWKKVFWWW